MGGAPTVTYMYTVRVPMGGAPTVTYMYNVSHTVGPVLIARV